MSEVATESQPKMAKLALPTPSNAKKGPSNAFPTAFQPGKKPLPTPFQRLPTHVLPTPLIPPRALEAALGSLKARPAASNAPSARRRDCVRFAPSEKWSNGAR
jgi:hypothetical protein